MVLNKLLEALNQEESKEVFSEYKRHIREFHTIFNYHITFLVFYVLFEAVLVLTDITAVMKSVSRISLLAEIGLAVLFGSFLLQLYRGYRSAKSMDTGESQEGIFGRRPAGHYIIAIFWILSILTSLYIGYSMFPLFSVGQLAMIIFSLGFLASAIELFRNPRLGAVLSMLMASLLIGAGITALFVTPENFSAVTPFLSGLILVYFYPQLSRL